MKIPFVDLKLQYQNYKVELDEAISKIIQETAFVGGSSNKYCRQFETDFAAFLNVKHVISCANGTDSLEILLEAYGVGIGDEVINFFSDVMHRKLDMIQTAFLKSTDALFSEANAGCNQVTVIAQFAGLDHDIFNIVT